MNSMYNVRITGLVDGRLAHFQDEALSFEGAMQKVREARRASDKLYRVRITEVGARRFEKEKSES